LPIADDFRSTGDLPPPRYGGGVSTRVRGDTSDRGLRRAGLLDWAVLIAGYGLSRVVASAFFGVEFDDNPLIWFWQYLDPELLRDDALRSIFYQHAQPPLWNLYLAGVTKACGDASTTCFAASFLASGLVLHLGLFGLMLRLGVDRRIALGLALTFAFSPASILYENWLFYTQPIAALLVLAALFIARVVAHAGRPLDLVVFATLTAAVVLTRSLFHLVWLAFALGLVVWPLRADWRRVLACVFLPVLLCVGLYAKNAAVFGSFSSSSWMGMSLARLAIEPLPLEERKALVAAGQIGAVSLVKPFSPVDAYPPGLLAGARHDHPALTERQKSTTAVNFNHGAYPAIARAYLRDARTLIRHRPDVYATSVFEAWSQFAMDPALVLFLETNRDRMGVYAGLWSAGFYGFMLKPLPTDRPITRRDFEYEMHAWGWIFLMLAFGAVVIALLRGIREWTGDGGDRALGATLLFVAGTVAYVSLVGNSLELGENNRFRFMIEPFLFALIGWLLDGVLGRRSAPAATKPDEDGDGGTRSDRTPRVPTSDRLEPRSSTCHNPAHP